MCRLISLIPTRHFKLDFDRVRLADVQYVNVIKKACVWKVKLNMKKLSLLIIIINVSIYSYFFNNKLHSLKL